MYIDFIWLFGLIQWAQDVVTKIEELSDALAMHNEPTYADLTLEQKTEILKRCTRIVANLDLDLACYPLGYTTTILFDLDGNPVY